LPSSISSFSEIETKDKHKASVKRSASIRRNKKKEIKRNFKNFSLSFVVIKHKTFGYDFSFY